MKVPKTYKAAYEVLRAMIRFDGAVICLPGTGVGGDDTPVIRQATKLYVELWVIPLIDALESGDLRRLGPFIGANRRHKMGVEYADKTT